MVRPSLITKSFNIAPDELESARYCAREQGVSLNKYLRLAVLEKNRGVVQWLEASDALGDIRATVRESETRNALALEGLIADLRAEQDAALQSVVISSATMPTLLQRTKAFRRASLPPHAS